MRESQFNEPQFKARVQGLEVFLLGMDVVNLRVLMDEVKRKWAGCSLSERLLLFTAAIDLYETNRRLRGESR
jgi:hypothetical protein